MFCGLLCSTIKLNIRHAFRIIPGPEYDSLVGVTKHQSFFVDSQYNPVNYSTHDCNWPFTQSVRPLYEINSSIFIASRKVMCLNQDRVGKHPLFFLTNSLESIDIDTIEQFDYASKIYNSLKSSH